MKIQYVTFSPQSNYTGSSLNNGSSTHSVDGKSHSDVILIPPIGDGSINSQVCHGRGWLKGVVIREYSVDGKSHSDDILIPPIGDGSINSQVCHGRGGWRGGDGGGTL